MYIGSTDARGLHHLVWEVVDNSIDEAMAGHATTIEVTIHADGKVVVQDDGRGVPVGKHRPARTPSRSSTPSSTPAASSAAAATRCRGGLHGVGVSVVNALSEVDARRIGARRAGLGPGVRARQADRAGQEDRTAGRPDAARRPASSADPEMFETIEYSFDLISQRLRESAYLTKGVWITLDRRADRPRAVVLLRGRPRSLRAPPQPEQGGPPHAARSTSSGAKAATAVEVALQYNDTYTENVLAFANNINTVDGGTHVTGFRAALTSSLNDWARRAGVLKDADGNLSGDDVREGLTAVISVKLTDPQFEGQTKAKLGNAEVKGQVQTAVADSLGQYLDENPARRPPDHREVPDRRARPRGRPQGARPGHPQGRPRRHVTARQARRLPGARPGPERAVHRRGRLGRRLGQAGPRPALPGDPAAARQAAQRREGAPRQDPVERERPAADHRPRGRASARASTSRSCATTGSSS